MLQSKKKSEDKSSSSSSSPTTSAYRGVSFNSHSQKWKAVITVGRKQYFLGYFVQEIEAARAYDKASLELRGPEAPTNFKYDAEALAAAAAAALVRQQQNNNNHGTMHQSQDDEMEVEDSQCASLEKLLDGQTGDSIESVRDVEMEVQAVRHTLLMREQALVNAQRAANSQRPKTGDIPPEFMIL